MASTSDHLQAAPVASGDLTATPFGHLVLYLYRRNSSGTLVVADETGAQSRVLFVDGRAAAGCFPKRPGTLFAGMLPLCGIARGEYAFYDGDLVSAVPMHRKGKVDPFELLSTSLEEHARDDAVAGVLARMRDWPLRLQPGCDLRRLKLDDEADRLIDLIRAAPTTVAELQAQSPLSATRTRRVLYLLTVSFMVAPYDPRSRSEGSDAPASHSVSGRPTSSSTRTPAQLGAPRPTFRSVNEVAQGGAPAWRSLASLRPTPSGSWPARDTSPSAVEEPPMRRLDRFVERGDFVSAAALAEELLEAAGASPQSELLAVHAHVLFRLHIGDPAGPPDTARESLRRALDLEPGNARALLTKGLMYKQAGDQRRAIVCFRRALKADPRNLEAQRELRLARMRTR